MKDNKTLSFINLYGVLGALENLCELDNEAKAFASPKKSTAVRFNVTDGPDGTLIFNKGKCKLIKGKAKSNILIKKGSPEKFNGVLDGTSLPIPCKGFLKINFLLKNFQGLAGILTKYLKATPEDLKDRDFFVKSTTLMFYVITEALSQIGNNDRIGKFSASFIPDGVISMGIEGGPYVSILVKKGHMTTFKEKAVNPRSSMIFADMDIARNLFDGKVDAMELIGNGKIVLTGFIPMIDNLNKILSKVALYLA